MAKSAVKIRGDADGLRSDLSQTRQLTEIGFAQLSDNVSRCKVNSYREAH